MLPQAAPRLKRRGARYATTQGMVRIGLLVTLAAAAAVACSDGADGGTGAPAPGEGEGEGEGEGRPAVSWRVHDDGTADLLAGDRVVIRRARAEALVEIDGVQTTLSTADPACERPWTDERTYSTTPLGKAESSRAVCRFPALSLEWTVYALEGRPAALARASVGAEGTGATLLRISPVVSTPPEGGLFVGPDPSTHRILDNGQHLALDNASELHYPDEARLPLLDALHVLEGRGDVVATWDHAVVDLTTGRGFVAGALSAERAWPLFGTSYRPGTAPVGGEGRGFEAFFADQPLAFFGKPLGAGEGEALGSECVWIEPDTDDPWGALGRWASAVATWTGREPWMSRDGGRPVPNGWNSWTGGGGAGGLGTNIDEAILAENVEVMAREFAPFGIDYFQVDDGYQVADGDWIWRADRFPAGLEPLMERIVDEGLKPGLWISAFSVAERSSLAAAHPEWLADPEDNLLAGLYGPDEGDRVLDLSHPEALTWLEETMARYRKDYRVEWLKHDFGYLALPFRPRATPELTALEAYRGALRAMRRGLGEEVFFLGIGPMGAHFGIADGVRTTLDAGPVWEERMPFVLGGEGNNVKTTVKTATRRAYMHGNLWANHDDLLFFRSEAGKPELTHEEATTYASWMGLAGSIVKFGEDLRTLTPEQIGVWRRLIPSYPAAARPLDVFSRHYPEEYCLPVKPQRAPDAEGWLVVGLFNWGRNYDFEQPGEPAKLEDEARTYRVDLEKCGLEAAERYVAFELWSGTYLGEIGPELELEVPAHGNAVVAVRRALGHPQLLGHDRHLTQGATDLVEERWDEGTKTLHLAFDVNAGPEGAVPFVYHTSVRVPAGWTLAQADVGSGAAEEEGEVLTVTYEPERPHRYAMALGF